jgi:hypothetical protein
MGGKFDARIIGGCYQFGGALGHVKLINDNLNNMHSNDDIICLAITVV